MEPVDISLLKHRLDSGDRELALPLANRIEPQGFRVGGHGFNGLATGWE